MRSTVGYIMQRMLGPRTSEQWIVQHASSHTHDPSYRSLLVWGVVAISVRIGWMLQFTAHSV